MSELMKKLRSKYPGKCAAPKCLARDIKVGDWIWWKPKHGSFHEVCAPDGKVPEGSVDKETWVAQQAAKQPPLAAAPYDPHAGIPDSTSKTFPKKCLRYATCGSIMTGPTSFGTVNTCSKCWMSNQQTAQQATAVSGISKLDSTLEKLKPAESKPSEKRPDGSTDRFQLIEID